jgi:large subunit ribosomal protein L26e
MLQGREGKIVQVYRKKWVIHIERITREKVNGMWLTSVLWKWKHIMRASHLDGARRYAVNNTDPS